MDRFHRLSKGTRPILELDLEPLRSFIAQRIVDAEEAVQSGQVAKTVDIRKVSPEIRALMMEALNCGVGEVQELQRCNSHLGKGASESAG